MLLPVSSDIKMKQNETKYIKCSAKASSHKLLISLGHLPLFLLTVIMRVAVGKLYYHYHNSFPFPFPIPLSILVAIVSTSRKCQSAAGKNSSRSWIQRCPCCRSSSQSHLCSRYYSSPFDADNAISALHAACNLLLCNVSFNFCPLTFPQQFFKEPPRQSTLVVAIYLHKVN